MKKNCNPRRKKSGESDAQYRKRCGPRPLGQIKMGEKKNPRVPRKKGQPAGSKKHSDLYTDENPKGTIKGLKFATVKDAKASVSKINGSGKKHAHKIQAAVAMEQRAKEMGKTSQAGVYRAYINKMKKITKKRQSESVMNVSKEKLIEMIKEEYQNILSENNMMTEAQFDEAAGKKDKCYYKVKARYDVWPSAYASGALVKCRKVGAANWGNKSKKEVKEDNIKINKKEMDKLHKGEKVSKNGDEIEYVVENYYDYQDFTSYMKENYSGLEEGKLEEAEYQGRKVKLGKPMQGDAKKFKVYVKNPKGNVVKVNFGQGGDAKGGTMRIRKSNPKARANFRARHNCDNPGPRHKARYWSCRKW